MFVEKNGLQNEAEIFQVVCNKVLRRASAEFTDLTNTLNFMYSVAYLSSYHEKAINALCELA